MPERSIDSTQRAYARFAGFMYILNYVLNFIGELTPSWIRGSGDFAETARRVLASEYLYRSALTSTTIAWVSIVILGFALYVTLEPVNKRLAQLALFLRLGEAFVGGATVMVSFAIVRLYTTTQATALFQNDQLQALASVAWSAFGSGFQIAMTFVSVGSTLFFYLFYKSRYIPRPLAAFGVFASVVMLMVSCAILILPEHLRTLQYGWAPMFLAEVTTAFWLILAGIRQAPAVIGEVAPGRG